LLSFPALGNSERGETERSRYSESSAPGTNHPTLHGDDAFVNFLDEVDGSRDPDSEETPHKKEDPPGSPVENNEEDRSAFKAPPEEDHHEEAHHVVDKVELEKVEQHLNQVLADTAQEIQKSLESLFMDSKKELQGSTLEMLGYTMGIHADSAKRLKLLTQQERRLEIAMMHGQYGKCCCTPPEGNKTEAPKNAPTCSWSVGAQLLGKFSRKCDLDKIAYTEFLGYPEEGSLEDQMLDECGKTPDWLQYARNQIVNECDFFEQKLDRDVQGLSSYLR
jgi:hypothetical protein